tara:strand:- start:17117 stop:17458 length:342 start_codon:yes stop_codon:yes gene_type:complete
MDERGPLRLDELASFIKSTNAGATKLTFDIGFADEETFRVALDSGAINKAVVSALYGVPQDAIEIYEYAPAQIIKVTIPRSVMSGGLAERDFDGVQQFAPLLDIPVPLDERTG